MSRETTAYSLDIKVIEYATRMGTTPEFRNASHFVELCIREWCKLHPENIIQKT